MGSLKVDVRLNWSSIEIMALNCLVFEKTMFCARDSCDEQTDRQTDRQRDMAIA